MGKTMLQRHHEENLKFFESGMETGEQYAADCFAFAMEDAGISKPKIAEIFKAANRYEYENASVMDARPHHNDDCDWERQRFDNRLKKIFGTLFNSWDERYPFIKRT